MSKTRFKRGDKVRNVFSKRTGIVRFSGKPFFSVQTSSGHRISNPKYWKKCKR